MWWYIMWFLITIGVNIGIYQSYSHRLDSIVHEQERICEYVDSWKDLDIVLSFIQVIKQHYQVLIGMLFKPDYMTKYLCQIKIVEEVIVLDKDNIEEMKVLFKKDPFRTSETDASSSSSSPSYYEEYDNSDSLEESEVMVELEDKYRSIFQKFIVDIFHQYILRILRVYNQLTQQQMEGFEPFIEQFLLYKIRDLFGDEYQVLDILSENIYHVVTKIIPFRRLGMSRRKFRRFLEDVFDDVMRFEEE